MKSGIEILGESFLLQNNMVFRKDAFKNIKIIGIYFAANWCPSCIFRC